MVIFALLVLAFGLAIGHSATIRESDTLRDLSLYVLGASSGLFISLWFI